MKKLLSILGVFGLIIPACTTVIACNDADIIDDNDDDFSIDLATDLEGATKEVVKFDTSIDTEDIAKTQLKAKYDDLNIDAIDVDISTENKLVVTNSKDSNYYADGRVEIIYVDPVHNKLDVELVIDQKHVGEVKVSEEANANWANMTAAIKVANPLIDVDHLTNQNIVSQFTLGSWHVNVIEDGIYKQREENIVFTFDVIQIGFDLSVDLAGSTQEVVSFNASITTEAVVKAQLKAKYTNLNIDAIDVDITTENKLVVTNKKTSDHYKDGRVEIIYVDPVHKQLDINLVIAEKYVGEVEFSEVDTRLSWNNMLAAIKRVNPLLDVNQLTRSSYSIKEGISTWPVNVIQNGIYKQLPEDISFTFTVIRIFLDLASDLAGSTEEVVRFDASIDTEDIAKAQLKAKYSKLEMDAINVDISTENKLIVTNKKELKVYADARIEIFYVDPVHKQLNIDLLIVETNIGEVLIPDAGGFRSLDNILAAIKRVNPLVEIDQLTNQGYVGSTMPARWFINVIEDGLYKEHSRNLAFTFIEVNP